jgi:hypothetical protein
VRSEGKRMEGMERDGGKKDFEREVGGDAPGKAMR